MKSKRDSLPDDLFDKMLEIASLSKESTIDVYWRFNNTITREQYSSLKKEGVEMIQKALKINKRKAISTFNFFYKNFGVRLKG